MYANFTNIQTQVFWAKVNGPIILKFNNLAQCTVVVSLCFGNFIAILSNAITNLKQFNLCGSIELLVFEFALRVVDQIFVYTVLQFVISQNRIQQTKSTDQLHCFHRIKPVLQCAKANFCYQLSNIKVKTTRIASK